jgi:hypothetical protein
MADDLDRLGGLAKKLLSVLGVIWKASGGKKQVRDLLGGGKVAEEALESLFGPAADQGSGAPPARPIPLGSTAGGPPMGQLHRTPGSSNVWGFSFVPDSSRRAGTLYVTFLRSAFHKLHRPSGSKVQVHGTKGKTHAGKLNQPGAQYAYFSVPTTLYRRFLTANSAGRFVWDELRIRGTIYGHQYRYQLVAGVIDTETGGLYVPRKATRKGFQKRALAVDGKGKRGFITSSLEPSKPRKMGFTTKRVGNRPAEHESLGFTRKKR